MKKHVNFILAMAATWSLCLILLGGVLPWAGLPDLTGGYLAVLAEWTPLATAIFGLSTAMMVFRHRKYGRYFSRRKGEDRDQWGRFSMDAPLVVMGLDQPLPAMSATMSVPFSHSARAALRASSGRPDLIPAVKSERGSSVVLAPEAVEEVVSPGTEEDFPHDSTIDVNRGRMAGMPGETMGEGEMNDDSSVTINQLPPVIPDFAGRSFELSELVAAARSSGARAIGVLGQGGVGKTTLAVRFAHQVAPFYPDARLFIDLRGASDQPLSVAEAQGEVIRAYLPAVRLPEHEAELNRLYRSVMTGRRGLLVLDNVASAQQVAALMPPDGWLTILTTRQSLTLSGMFLKRLDCLSPVESRQLLLRLAPQLASEMAMEADRLAECCGHLPLALRVAVCTLTQHPDLRIDHYIDHLTAHPAKGNPVETVFETGYGLLSPGLKKLWRFLTAFHGSFDLQAAATVWKLNPQRAAEALGRLMSYSMVEQNPETGRYRLHDLTLRFLDRRLSVEERQSARYRFSLHYQSVLHEAEALYERGGTMLKQGVDLLDLEWQNVQAGQVWAATAARNDRGACELCNSYPDAGKFLLNLRQHPRERIRWNEAALESARALKRRKAACRHLVALGDCYIDLSEIERARDCYRQALEMSLAIGDRRAQADARIGLGNAGYLAGALDEARTSHEEALSLAQELQDHRAEAVALGSLAMTHYARGEAQTAQMLFEQQFRLAREIGDRRNESVALGGIGMTHLALEQLEPAIEFLGRQFLIAREIGDRRGEASALSHLGNAYVARRDFQKALDMLEEALSVAHDLGDRRCEANTLGGLGAAYFYQGDQTIARQFFDRQMTLARSIGDRRGESLATINLSEIASSTGDTRLAIELAQQAIRAAAQTGDNFVNGTALFHLAIACAAQGDRRKAIANAEKARACLEATQLPFLAEIETRLAEWRKKQSA